MKKVKLLIITDEMEVGGSQRQIVNILKNINTDLFDPHLVYFRKHSYLVDDLIASGIPVTLIEKSKKIDLPFLWNFYKFMKKGNFNLVHAFSFTGEIWGTLVHLFTFKGAFLSSVRGTYEWYSYRQWFLKKIVTLHSLFVVSNSEIAGKYAFDKMNSRIEKLKVLHNGLNAIENSSIKPQDIELIQSDYNWTIAFVGRLVDHKNLPSLLKAAKVIEERGINDIAVLIIGDGPDRSMLEKQANSNNLTNIYFLGERNDVPSILQMVNAAVSTSFREGLSNTILEAMAVGLPVIASNVGGTPEIIQHELNGLLYTSNSEIELADKIINLYSNPELSSRLGANARSHIKMKFSMDAMISTVQSIYTSAVNSNEGSLT